MSIQDRIRQVNALPEPLEGAPSPELPEASPEPDAGKPLEEFRSIQSAGFEAQLCLGLLYGRQRHTNIIVSELTGEAKSQLFNESVEENPAKAITRFTGALIEQIGPFNRKQLLEEKQAAVWMDIVRRLTIVDSEHILLLSAMKTCRKPLVMTQKCPNPKCGTKNEISFMPKDIDVLQYEQDLEQTFDERYLLDLDLSDVGLDVQAQIVLPNRLDAETIAGMDESNDYLQQRAFWNRILRSVNGRSDVDPLDRDFFSLFDIEENQTEELLILFDGAMPGPQKLHFVNCASCDSDMMVKLNMISFLSPDLRNIDKKLKKQQSKMKPMKKHS